MNIFFANSFSQVVYTIKQYAIIKNICSLMCNSHNITEFNDKVQNHKILKEYINILAIIFYIYTQSLCCGIYI